MGSCIGGKVSHGWGNVLAGSSPGGELSKWGVVLVGRCPVGKCPGVESWKGVVLVMGSHPGGSCLGDGESSGWELSW